MRVLSAENVIHYNKYICEAYKIEHAILNRSLVESAVGSAFMQLEGVGFLHGQVPEVAAALCYKIVQNHAFRDGNKRTAAISSLALLDLNSWELNYLQYHDGTEFHKIIEAVAMGLLSDVELKDWFVEHAENIAV